MKEYKLDPKILTSLEVDFKIAELTEIQKKVIPLILENKNVIGISETGSGKTLSYIIPCLNQIINKAKKPTTLLIITPTKELSQQILAVIKKTAKYSKLISTSLYGGTSFNEQVRTLNKGVHIIVACPGRLKDHIEKNTIDLSGIETVILDEADQLLDMGFLPDITEAFKALANRRQTHLFSATFNDEVKILAREFISNYELIELQNTTAKATIEEHFCPISPELKYPFLRFLIKLKKIKFLLIFTRTKDEAQKLGEQLIADKYRAVILQGDMSTHQRKKAIGALKEKKVSILVATDVASRGLDIPHVTHVLNYNPPESFESYIHRIGRTARHERTGEAITLYTPDEWPKLEHILKGTKITHRTFKDFDYQLKIPKRLQKIF